MAEMIQPQKSGKRHKLPQPCIDLTPMVDLGFLLITFFMYTTTMTKPNTMQINLPDNQQTNDPTKFIEEATITLIPTAAHKIIYYEGALNNTEQLHKTDFQPENGIRDILLKKKNAVAALPATFSPDAHKLHVIIKPADDCTYEDVVTTLDEMNILDVPYYAMTDLSASEKELLEK